MDNQLDVIVRRLDSLERQNRRLKRAGLLTAVGAVAALICGAMNQQQGRLDVRDGNGQIRVSMAVNPGDIDEAGVDIFDKIGKRRIWIGTGPSNDTQLVMWGSSGNVLKTLP